MMIYLPEDRIENKLTILQESVGAGFVRLEQKLDGKEEDVVEEDVEKNTPQPVEINSEWFSRELDKFYAHHDVRDFN